MAMTIEQQRAIAMANARRRASEAGTQLPEQPGAFSDVLQSAGAGLVRGVTGLVGLPDAMSDLMGTAVAGAGRAMGFEPGQIPEGVTPGFVDLLPSTEQVDRAVETVTGPLHEPQTTAGQYARTVGEFAPGVLAGPGGVVRRALTNVVAPAVGSETAGQVTEGTAAEPWARVGGAIAGGLAPSAIGRAISPMPVNAERQAAVQTLRREGVNPTAGQATGRDTLRYMESEIGGGRAARAMEQQGEDFTRAVLRRVGENANRATPEVIDRAFSRIGGQFDRLARRNTLRGDRQMAQSIADSVDEYFQMVPEGSRAPAVENIVRGIETTLRRTDGQIPGKVYQSLRSRIDKMARRSLRDPELSNTLFNIRNALDDAMERTLAATSPDDLGAWREARSQYRNMLVVEKAAVGAGEKAAEGIITPAKLRQATVGQSRRSYARGRGDFAELARAGNQVLAPLPNSGTASRIGARNLGVTLGSMMGAGAGGLAMGPAGGMAGAVAGTAAPYVVGRAMMSRPVQRYLSNQMAAPLLDNLTPGASMALGGLLGSRELRAGP